MKSMEELLMSNIFKSLAFQDFIQKRCEEILMNDKEYLKINNRITELESEINNLASGNLLKKIREYEKLNSDSIACCAPLLYIHATKDFKGIYND
jgi:hypothetical protein